MFGIFSEKKINIPHSLFGVKPGVKTNFNVFYLISNILKYIEKEPLPSLLRQLLVIMNSDRNYNKPFPQEMLMTDTVNDSTGCGRYCYLIDIIRSYVFQCSEENLQGIYKTIFPEYPAVLISTEGDTVLLGDEKSKDNIERTLRFIFLVFLWLLESHGDDFYRMYYYTFESLGFENPYRKLPDELDGKESNKEKAKIMTISIKPFLVRSNNRSLKTFEVDQKFVPSNFCYLHKNNNNMVSEIKKYYGIAKNNLEEELLNSSTLPKELILMIVSILFGNDKDVNLDTLLETVPLLMRNLFV